MREEEVKNVEFEMLSDDENHKRFRGNYIGVT